MEAITEQEAVAGAAEADDDQPERLQDYSGDACEDPRTSPAAAADPELVMRFNVACAIVDLKWDTWEFIKTHYLSKPASSASGDGASAAAGEQPDGGGDDDDDLDIGELDIVDDEDEEEEGEEEEGDGRSAFLREFRANYIKASGFDDRMKELDAIKEVYFDKDLDEETRTATIHKMWGHLEKELSDRARAVSTGKFKF